MSNKWYSNWECGEDIICPYCGMMYETSYKDTYIGGEPVDCCTEEYQEYVCDRCGKKFGLSVEKTWEYATTTIDGEMTEEDHEDMDYFFRLRQKGVNMKYSDEKQHRKAEEDFAECIRDSIKAVFDNAPTIIEPYKSESEKV